MREFFLGGLDKQMQREELYQEIQRHLSTPNSGNSSRIAKFDFPRGRPGSGNVNQGICFVLCHFVEDAQRIKMQRRITINPRNEFAGENGTAGISNAVRVDAEVKAVNMEKRRIAWIDHRAQIESELNGSN